MNAVEEVIKSIKDMKRRMGRFPTVVYLCDDELMACLHEAIPWLPTRATLPITLWGIPLRNLRELDKTAA